jgi:hypothetical protein
MERHGAKDYWHDRLLLQLGDSSDTVIDLGFLKLVRRNLSRVLAIYVIPHTVGSLSQRMDSTLDEGLVKLET